MSKSPQRKLARITAAVLVGLSTILFTVLVGSVLGDAYERLSSRLQGLSFLLLHFAGIALPVAVLLTGMLIAGGLLLLSRPVLRTWPLVLGCVSAAVVLVCAWEMGLRIPKSREGEFRGRYVLNPLCCRSDIFMPNEDPRDPLPRGAQLGLPREWKEEIPLTAAVRVPKDGWHGSHPVSWPSTYSDSHGAQSFCVRVRGRLTGPGQYGWPPVLQYRLTVDSVIQTAARLPGEDRECVAPLD